MTEPLDQLTQALADGYTIHRELGSGGMATVYLAEDLKHLQDVADHAPGCIALPSFLDPCR